MRVISTMLCLVLWVSVVALQNAEGATDADRIKILELRMAELEGKSEESSSSSSSERLQIHGYGELHYGSTDKPGGDDKMDFHRMVIGLSYKYTDNIILDVEVDFEHAATEMELELAHISFLLSDALNLRIGSMLMPIGTLNETHEPPLFYSVERPYIQKYVIPTSWNEGGVGLFGELTPGLDYRLYVVGGLDATGFTGANGIRKGRGKVAESIANDLAVAGRLEYEPLLGVEIGTSGYHGNSGQNEAELGDTPVTILEADIRCRKGILEAQSSIVSVDIGDTEELNAFLSDETKTEVVGEQILGWNVEAACHLGQLFLPLGQDLVTFVRYEEFNTQEDVATGFVADPANDRQVTTAGIAYYPTEQVAIKADIEMWDDGAGADWTQANLGLAFIY